MIDDRVTSHWLFSHRKFFLLILLMKEFILLEIFLFLFSHDFVSTTKSFCSLKFKGSLWNLRMEIDREKERLSVGDTARPVVWSEDLRKEQIDLLGVCWVCMSGKISRWRKRERRRDCESVSVTCQEGTSWNVIS